MYNMHNIYNIDFCSGKKNTYFRQRNLILKGFFFSRRKGLLRLHC